MRTFIALPLSIETIESLARVGRVLSSCGGMKLVEPENMHVTLKFLGEVGEDDVEGIIEGLWFISGQKSFKIQVKGLGVFPNMENVKIVWAGVSEGEDQVMKLQALIEKQLAEL
ncbi:MAG: RNA 2',3'-cyclic phosphodiesterase, partial [Candidatus Altiarchaeota archaeon]